MKTTLKLMITALMAVMAFGNVGAMQGPRVRNRGRNGRTKVYQPVRQSSRNRGKGRQGSKRNPQRNPQPRKTVRLTKQERERKAINRLYPSYVQAMEDILAREDNWNVAISELYATILQDKEIALTRRNNRGISWEKVYDAVYARIFQDQENELHDGSDEDPVEKQIRQDAEIARRLDQGEDITQPEERNNPAESEENNAEPVECSICMERQTDMSASCCLQKICGTCWNETVQRDAESRCPFCRTVQQ